MTRRSITWQAARAAIRGPRRIGIGVRHGALAVVLMRRDETACASATVAYSGDHPTTEDFIRAISFVLPNIEAQRTRATLHIAVGPAASQLRRLDRLPALRNAAALAMLVRENASSFFLKPSVPVVVCGPGGALRDGSAWVVAFDAPIIHALASTARALGIHHATAVPVSIALLPTAPGPSSSHWVDGRIAIDTTFRDGALEQVTRRAVAVPSERMLDLTNDEDAPSYADAHGAIRHRGHHLRWSTPSLWRERARRARAWCAAALLLASVSALLLGPTLRDIHTAERNEARLSLLRKEVADAGRVESAWRKDAAVVSRLHEFSKRRVGALELLATFTKALPDSTALVAFHVDSLGGSASIIGRDVMGALAELQAGRDFSSIEITTPITRETTGSLELERVALKFTLTRSIAHESRTLAAPVRASAQSRAASTQ